MNAKKFSDAMSELDTKYVDEALNYKTKMKKPIWIKWGIMAACLCLIICVVTIPRLLNGSNPPISGDLAPMVYVNNKLYQYTDSQLDFTDKESQFTYLGEIESKVIMAVDKSDFLTIRVVLICHLRFPPFSNSILNFVLPSSDTSIKTVASKVLPVLSDLQFLSFTLPEPSNFCAVAEVMLLPMLAK